MTHSFWWASLTFIEEDKDDLKHYLDFYYLRTCDDILIPLANVYLVHEEFFNY